MKQFNFVDRILEVADSHIRARKNLTINEDYLLDHFKNYPVMPGVLMTQSLVEAAGWWILKKTDFRAQNIRLQAVKNVRFANFLRPGDILEIEVQNKSLAEGRAQFQAKGRKEEKIALSLQFTLNYDRFLGRSGKKSETIQKELALYQLLLKPAGPLGG